MSQHAQAGNLGLLQSNFCTFASGAEEFDVHVYVPALLLNVHIELQVVTAQTF